MSNSDTRFALNITITYASIYGFVIFITSIVCADQIRKMRKNQKQTSSEASSTDRATFNAPDDEQKTLTQHPDESIDKFITIEIQDKTNNKTNSFTKEWFKLLQQKKSVYLSLIPHIFDQATDFGVIYQYHALWKDDGRELVEVGAANPKSFFYASIFVIILHRIASSIGIYTLTRKSTDFMLQMFDLMMIKAIWVNYKLRKNEKANPQRFLEILEATFESGPQLLISSAYMLKASTSDSHEITVLMMISVLFSLWSITSRVTSDDKSIFNLNKTDRIKWTEFGFKYNKCPCCNWRYVFRVIVWRFFEITNRMFICILIWVNLGGLAISIIFGIEFIWCFTIAILNGSVDPMSLMMYLSTNIPSIGFQLAYKLYMAFCLYRVFTLFFYLVLITFFANLNFEAQHVEEYETRNYITMQIAFGRYILIYSWITSFIWPYAALYILPMDELNPSTPRHIRDLIANAQFDDIVELMEFGIKMTADDVNKTLDRESSLDKISRLILRYGINIVTLNFLIVLRDIIALVPDTTDRNHYRLWKLESVCQNGGELVHIAVCVYKLSRDIEIEETENYEKKSTQILQQIIDHNIDINVCNNDNETALHLIAKGDLKDCDLCNAKILLRNGINKNIKNKSNETALDVIMKRENVSKKQNGKTFIVLLQ